MPTVTVKIEDKEAKSLNKAFTKRLDNLEKVLSALKKKETKIDLSKLIRLVESQQSKQIRLIKSIQPKDNSPMIAKAMSHRMEILERVLKSLKQNPHQGEDKILALIKSMSVNQKDQLKSFENTTSSLLKAFKDSVKKPQVFTTVIKRGMSVIPSPS